METVFKTRAGEVPASQMTLDDLDWYANECKSQRLKDAAIAEIARRRGGGQQAPAAAAAAAPAAALAVAADVRIVTGAFRDATRATDALRQASAVGHLVAPAPICGSLPEGCALALAAVQVNVDHETYNLPGSKKGLSKPALDRIAAAAGISWDPQHSRRLDDGSDPHYCHYKAVGRVRDFDGTVRMVQGEVEMDARAGSPLLEEIRVKQANKQGGDGGASQVLELRKFLLRHAESKAKNRAIRSLGVRTSYDANELKKPFLVAKVMFTGETNDPELRRMFAEKTAESFLGAGAALFGQPLATPALPAADATHAPPPVGSVPADTSARTVEGEGEDMPPDMPPAKPAAPAAAGTERY